MLYIYIVILLAIFPKATSLKTINQATFDCSNVNAVKYYDALSPSAFIDRKICLLRDRKQLCLEKHLE